MKTICAALIVKNESRVIKRCLDSIKGYIDYWVVCDTGSTDDTKDIITSQLSAIPGELHEVPWVNFGHNRSQLLELCKDKCDYLLLIDADEVLMVHNESFKEKLELDSYLVKFEGDLEWRQKKLISNKINWKYEGVTHEYITSDQDLHFEHINCISLNHLCDGSRRPEKFQDDINLLKNALEDDPKNQRYWFYLAQCYFDLGQYEHALDAYHERILLGGWNEEIYYSQYKKAMCIKNISPEFPVEEFLKAHEIRPSRFEAMYQIIKHFREKRFHHAAYTLCKKEIIKPESKDILFIDKSINNYKLQDELAVCAYWVGEYQESLDLNKKLLENPNLPQHERERIQKNTEFAQNKIQE